MEPAPPCRICGKTEWIAVHDSAHPERAICVECCGGKVEHHDGETGHEFDHEPGEGLMCRYCGVNIRDTDFDYGSDDL